MSEKFEENVLKKLDDLDSTMQNIVLKKLEKLDGLDSTMQNVVLKKLDNLEKEMGNLKIEVKDTQEVVTYLNNSFTKFDYEINKKIDTLFDAFITNKEKDLVHEKEIASLNAKTFNHDIRISNLENQVLAV